MQAKLRTAVLLAGAALSFGATGCTYALIAGGIAFGVLPSGGGGSSGSPPSLQVVSSTDRASLASVTQIPIDFQLFEASSSPVAVDVTWSTAASGTSFPATPATGSEDMRSLTSSPGGLQHRFIWNARADLRSQVAPTGVDKVVAVTLKLVPRTKLGGVPVTVSLVAGLTPPRVTITAQSQGTASRNVATALTLADDASDPVDLHLFVTAPGIARVEVPLIGISKGIATSPATTPTTVVWSSTGALGFTNVNATIEIDAVDRFGGTGMAQAMLAVQNDSPPSVQLLSLGTASQAALLDGRIPIRFALFDPEADLDPTGPSAHPDVLVEVSSDGGLTFASATGIVLQQGSRQIGVPSLKGLIAHRFDPLLPPFEGPLGNIHTFLWDAMADRASGAGALSVILRITPIERLAPPQQDLAGQSEIRSLQLGRAGQILGEEAVLSIDPGTLLLGDVNGDGHTDLLIIDPSQSGTTVLTGQVLLNNGTRGVNQWTAVPLPLGFTARALADVDRDGKLDLVEVAALPSSVVVQVYLGAGNGSFGPAITSTIRNASFPGLVEPPFVLADLDGDGRLDVAVVLPDGTLAVSLGTSTGPGSATFAAANVFAGLGPLAMPTAIAAANLRGAGLPDVLVTSTTPARLSVWLNGSPGPGAFRLLGLVATNGVTPKAVAVGDLNGDGKLDAVVSNQDSGDASIFLGNGDGTFAAPVLYPMGSGPSLALVDVDGDGKLDIVLANAGSSDIRIRRGQGDGTFGPLTTIPAAGSPLPFAIGDLDGDGATDFVYANPGRYTHVFFGTGGGGAGPDVEVSTPAITQTITVLGDTNGDRIPDLVLVASALGTPSSSSLTVRPGVPGGGFSTSPVYSATVPFGVADAKLADVNGDGALDLVLLYRASVSVLLGNGSGTFGAPRTFPLVPTSAATELALGDLNGDGLLDLVAVLPLQVLLNDGTGGFGVANVVTLTSGNDPFQATHAALADFGSRGKLDLLAVFATNAVGLSPGDGAGGFGPDIALSDAIGQVNGIVVADVMGHGRPDLVTVVKPQVAEAASIYPNAGGFAFGPQQPITFSAGVNDPLRVIAGDVDGSGRLSIVTANADANPLGQSNDLTIYHPRSLLARAPGGALLGRGDGQGLLPAWQRESVPLGFTPSGLGAVDLNGDGVTDLIATSRFGPVEPLVAAAMRGSSVEASLAGVVPGVPVPRSITVPPLDLALVATAAIVVAPASHLANASLARAFMPETASLAVPTSITIALSAGLTNEELATSVFHVLRNDQSQGFSYSRLTGAPLVGRTLEVARRDPGGGPLPAGVAPAVVDPVAGTITFQVLQLGRFQTFREASNTELVIYRDTFDALALDAQSRAPAAGGWNVDGQWAFGAPPAAFLLPGPAQRPLPTSAPSLLAIGLQGTPRPSATHVAATASFSLAAPPAGRQVFVRLREWHDLRAGDSARIDIVIENPAPFPPRQTILSLAPAAPPPPVLGLLEVPITANIPATLGQPGQIPVTTARLELVFTSGAAPGRGWFVDDLEVVIR